MGADCCGHGAKFDGLAEHVAMLYYGGEVA